VLRVISAVFGEIAFWTDAKRPDASRSLTNRKLARFSRCSQQTGRLRVARPCDSDFIAHLAADVEGKRADFQQAWAPWQVWRAVSAACIDWRVKDRSSQASWGVGLNASGISGEANCSHTKEDPWGPQAAAR
jgi:hypothetical protein